MDINKNQQINTFTKGMNTDTSDAYMPADQYRYAENLRVTSDNNGTTGELHLIEGTKKIEDTVQYYYNHWTQKENIAISSFNLTIPEPEDVYDFTIELQNIQINDSNKEDGDDVRIIVFFEEPGMLPCKVDNVNNVTSFADTPYETTIYDWIDRNSHYLGWVRDFFNISSVESHYWETVGINTGNAYYSLDTDSDTTTGLYFHILYVNYTQEYHSKVFKIGAEYRTTNVISTDSEFVITHPAYIDGIPGKILDVNYIKNICTIISVQDNKWQINIYDYEKNKLYLVAGPFDEPIWEAGVNLSNITKKILSTTLIWESDDNIKLYIADGIHDLMCIKLNKTSHGFKKITGTFAKVFGQSQILLPAPTVSISNSEGHIKGARVQYAYVVYEKYGTSTPLSSISKSLSLYKNNTSGFINKESNKAVTIQIPAISTSSEKYIRVYRIACIESGQQPNVNIIADQLISESITITDTGSNISDISVSELLSYISLGVRPKLIEQKNNYLFAANIKYTQEEIDQKFQDFDARCFSRGDYILGVGQFNGSNIQYFTDSDINNIKNYQFNDYSTYEWNSSYWEQISNTGYNGIGKYLKWKYQITEKNITPTDQTGTDKYSYNTYMRNEIYRFGIRLFDSSGNASSVKWIADIKMPDFYQVGDQSQNFITINNSNTTARILDITFVPNTDTQEAIDMWNNIAAYEIVQSPKSREDTYGITQGIGGYPSQAGDVGISAPYYLTTDRFLTGVVSYDDSQFDGTTNIATTVGGICNQNVKYLLFSSPEVTYQQDDVYQIINSGQWKIKNIFNYEYPHIDYSFNIPYKRFLPYLTAGHNHIPIMPNSGADIVPTDAYARLITSASGAIPVGVIADNAADYSLVDGGSKVGGYFIDNAIMATSSGASGGGYYVWKTILQPCAINMPEAEANCAIDSVANVESQNPDQFASATWITFRNNPISFDGTSYYNWTNPWAMHQARYADQNFDDCLTQTNVYNNYPWDVEGNGTEGWIYLLRMPISAGGRYMLLKPSVSEIINRNPSGRFDSATSDNLGMPRSPIFQIYQTGITPYGGRNKSSILSSTYIPVGGFQTGTSSITVKGGDGFIKYFIFNHTSAQYNSLRHNVNSQRIVYKIPLESHIDIQGQSSEYLYDDGAFVRDIAGTTYQHTQDTGLYVYEPAYNAIQDSITYYPNDEIDKRTQYATRIHYSQPKINNEQIDSWTRFKAIDFLDVDTRHGDITGIKLFKDKLIFLQDKAAGILSVNDRIIINDADSNNIILGSGGVLQRYDYITTLYGMKPEQNAYTASNNALYWWDGYNKEIIQYSDGYNINQLQHQKFLDSYVQSKSEFSTPSVFYDKRNKEVIFNVVNGGSIVYNEKIDQFTGIYTFCPVYHCDLISAQILINNSSNDLYKYNTSSSGGAKLFGVDATPKLKYVINEESLYNKVFDIQTFCGKFYGGSTIINNNNLPYYLKGEHGNSNLSPLTFTYNTPLKQESKTTGNSVTNYEYEYRLTIPRNGEGKSTNPFDKQKEWGNRMRGKTMQCELKSSSNNLDFSLQYIITKFRMSWT